MKMGVWQEKILRELLALIIDTLGPAGYADLLRHLFRKKLRDARHATALALVAAVLCGWYGSWQWSLLWIGLCPSLMWIQAFYMGTKNYRMRYGEAHPEIREIADFVLDEGSKTGL